MSQPWQRALIAVGTWVLVVSLNLAITHYLYAHPSPDNSITLELTVGALVSCAVTIWASRSPYRIIWGVLAGGSTVVAWIITALATWPID